jgi:DNA-binding NarL/FixJ family response regulator
MSENSPSPLTPALRRLLETCIILKTTEAKILAVHLNRSPATIRTEFQRILISMNVHSRYAALKAAEEHGWLHTGDSNEDI